MTNESTTRNRRIEKKNIADIVFKELENDIREEKLKIGEQLPGELELSKEFGVSRISIREALNRLQGMGYIEIRRGEGSFVCNTHSIRRISESKFEDLFDFLQIFDPACAELAAKFVDKQGLDKKYEEEIQKNLDTYWNKRVKIPTNDPDIDRLDQHFHIAISKITKNDIFISIMKEIHGESYDLLRKHGHNLIPNEVAYNDHKEVFDAIKAGDAHKAYTTMKKHIDRAEPAKKQV